MTRADIRVAVASGRYTLTGCVLRSRGKIRLCAIDRFGHPKLLTVDDG